MSCFVAVKGKDGKYKHFKVPPEILLYIRQLESYINDPSVSKLKTVYADRFPDKGD